MDSYARSELKLLTDLLEATRNKVTDDYSGRSRSLDRAVGSMQSVLRTRPLVQSVPKGQLPLLLGPTSAIVRTLNLPQEELPMVAAAAPDTVAGVVAKFRLERGV